MNSLYYRQGEAINGNCGDTYLLGRRGPAFNRRRSAAGRRAVKKKGRKGSTAYSNDRADHNEGFPFPSRSRRHVTYMGEKIKGRTEKTIREVRRVGSTIRKGGPNGLKKKETPSSCVCYGRATGGIGREKSPQDRGPFLKPLETISYYT